APQSTLLTFLLAHVQLPGQIDPFDEHTLLVANQDPHGGKTYLIQLAVTGDDTVGGKVGEFGRKSAQVNSAERFAPEVAADKPRQRALAGQHGELAVAEYRYIRDDPDGGVVVETIDLHTAGVENGYRLADHGVDLVLDGIMVDAGRAERLGAGKIGQGIQKTGLVIPG